MDLAEHYVDRYAVEVSTLNGLVRSADELGMPVDLTWMNTYPDLTGGERDSVHQYRRIIKASEAFTDDRDIREEPNFVQCVSGLSSAPMVRNQFNALHDEVPEFTSGSWAAQEYPSASAWPLVNRENAGKLFKSWPGRLDVWHGQRGPLDPGTMRMNAPPTFGGQSPPEQEFTMLVQGFSDEPIHVCGSGSGYDPHTAQPQQE